MHDLIIIGAGPAGVTAGIYASRQKLDVLIVSKDIGGQVARKAVDIENYPGFDKISGPDLASIFEQQLEKNGLKVALDEVLKIEKKDNKFIINTKYGEVYEALSVIVATGADPRPLEAEGEKEFIGKGVSYCALCDGPMFKNKTVAVVGGGNSGFETALFLSNYVQKIYILEFTDKIMADQENQVLLAKIGKAEIIKNAKVLKISARGGSASGGEGLVGSLTYQNLKNNSEKKLDLEGVFIEIGYSPATAFVKDLVDFSERDEILADVETFATKTSGLFAAGDCNKGKFKQIVTATGEGAKAALAAYEYLQKIKQ